MCSLEIQVQFKWHYSALLFLNIYHNIPPFVILYLKIPTYLLVLKPTFCFNPSLEPIKA